MLTSDLVRARRREGVLHAQYVTGDARGRLLPIARAYLDLYKRMIGRSREELDAAVGAIEISARDRVTALGVRKVLDDQCELEGPSGVEPEAVRREVFLAAAAAWKGLDVRGGLDRAAVLATAGEKLGRSAEEIEATLYADLRGAEVLRKVWDLGAEALLERYNVALAQSILLRATRVTVTVQGESPDRYRRLFRTMRFLGLLYSVTLHDEGAPSATGVTTAGIATSKGATKRTGPAPSGAIAEDGTGAGEKKKGPSKRGLSFTTEPVAVKDGATASQEKITKTGKTKGSRKVTKDAVPVGPSAKAVYTIVIDGPFSLFGASLKYGLRLATLLHAVLACARFTLIADVAWGPQKDALVFRVAPGDGLVAHAAELPSSSPAMETFVAGFEKLGSSWDVRENDRIFVVPGEPAVIPDLGFVNRKTGEEVLLEAFGFWSRAAVWTRVEQIRRGAVPARLLLAVSKELRVSSEVLEDDDAGEVYVYKATMLPRAVLERLEKRGKAA